jgi:hypothetical protein
MGRACQIMREKRERREDLSSLVAIERGFTADWQAFLLLFEIDGLFLL